MPSGICKGCNRATNSATSNWWLDTDDKGRKEIGVATLCSVAWVDGKPVKGCGYEKCSKFTRQYADSILKGQKYEEKN